ncbi:MAG: hypothetical protein K6C05_05760, partial [Anaerovibrio sp.]|uniref:hypothetical protein n=1 Tax=Anaerovibrio sp. TaxID=1872532 RepID=UPI0025F3809B
TIFSFNNGINTKYSSVCNNTIKDYLKNNNITFYDLSGSDVGFENYNDADLHIGFRVHSHIYSLSRRIPSILIEEDLRGYGINETLGLPHLLASDISCSSSNSDFVPNQGLCTHLSDLIRYNCANNFARYKGVFQNMKDLYYLSYLNWVNLLKNR